MGKFRIAAVFTHPIQYTAPFLRRAAAHPEIELSVFYLSRHGVEEAIDPGFQRVFKWDIPLLSGYKYEFLESPVLQLSRRLKKENFEFVWLADYARWESWMVWAIALARGIAVLLRGDSNLLEKRSLLRRLAKRPAVKLFLKGVAGVLFVGTCNRKFYEAFNFPPERMFFGPHTVDNEYFYALAAELFPRRKEIRKELGLPGEQPIILFAGKLVPKKRPESILRAFRDIRKELDCSLVFAGDGPLRVQLERVVTQENIPDVHFLGFLNQSKIPKAFVVGDLFVLPSGWDETWGLAINEAMNFSLPVIVTDKVAAAYDLVRSGENGFVVPFDDETALRESLAKMIADAKMRGRFGKKSLEIIKDWSFDALLKGLLAACQALRP